MRVLIDDIQLGREDGEKGVVLPGGVEKFVVDVELEKIPPDQADIPLGFLPVDLHPAQTDILLGQRGGQEGQSLAQPAVKPLPGVVFSHGELSHGHSSRFM